MCATCTCSMCAVQGFPLGMSKRLLWYCLDSTISIFCYPVAIDAVCLVQFSSSHCLAQFSNAVADQMSFFKWADRESFREGARLPSADMHFAIFSAKLQAILSFCIHARSAPSARSVLWCLWCWGVPCEAWGGPRPTVCRPRGVVVVFVWTVVWGIGHWQAEVDE